jgi:hypothetical protein
MKIIVDADACPVKREIVKMAKRTGVEVVLVCDTSHILDDSYASVVVVDKGNDSADFAIVNMAEEGDIVVTQDYGVAAMALSRGARAIGSRGTVYTHGNIDTFLAKRHLAMENRRKHGRYIKNSLNTENRGESFTHSLKRLIDGTPKEK